MQINRFEIENFKGIENTTINLRDEVPGNVVTLIGLNESGKTTILEAISSFLTEDKETTLLVSTVQPGLNTQDLIPKHHKAAFTGASIIRAVCTLEDSDIASLTSIFKRHDLLLRSGDLGREHTIERVYRFQDSELTGSQALWSIRFPVKPSKGRKKDFVVSSAAETRELWLAAVDYLRSEMPRIVYFPTFLFDFPHRINLEGDEDSETNSYYKKIIQDVLDSQGENLSIQKHIVDRIEKHRSKHDNPSTFFAHFFNLDEKKQIDSVVQKISNEMSKTVFGAWSDILGRNVSNKRIQLDWLLDGENNNSPFLQVSIVDGQSLYSLSERSLGFRWFFSFLLFTQFRKARETSTIFLFDEPAANLHSKAQIKLLETFSRIAAETTYIIYSTHSHYMVNPLWLEKAYIVDNKAIDYDDEDQVDSFAIKKTDVKATKYRTFVGKHPSRTTYFQPALDALDVPISPLERSSKAVIIEGKFDYHPFLYLRGKVSSSKLPEVFPASGAGNVGCLINLFRGWGVDFRIILDGDGAGKDGKKLYIKDYMVQEDHVMTLGDLVPELIGKSFEGFYQGDVLEHYANTIGIQETPNKRELSLMFQSLVGSKSDVSFPDTEKLFLPVMKWLHGSFGLDTSFDDRKPKLTAKTARKPSATKRRAK